MTQAWQFAVLVLGMLAAERTAIARLTRNERGREWIRRQWFMHPNWICIMRLPMGVASAVLWLWGWPTAAILWFSFWMVTDLTDGTIARRCGLGSATGKWLDPLSDKCMYFPILLMFGLQSGKVGLPLRWVAALLVIDAAGQASRLFTSKTAANYFGKAKTGLITILVSLCAFHQLAPMPLITERLLGQLTVSATILAFLSVYCKVVPDIWYANTLTLANFLCGLAAIWQVVHGHPLTAFVLVFVGQFFDLFDGRLAQVFGSTPRGPIFDDIADGTTFGVAIGMIVYVELEGGISGGLVAVVYTACTLYRLYRFIHPTVSLAPGVFQGLPSPAGAIVAGSAALLFAGLPYGRWAAAGAVLAAAALMVSSIPYRHFGRRIWPAVPRTGKLVCCILFLIFVNLTIAGSHHGTLFTGVLFGLGTVYVLWGVERARDAVGVTSAAGEP